MHNLPIFYYPTKIIFIDDDITCINKIVYNIEHLPFTFETHFEPEKYLEYLNNSYKSNALLEKIINKDNSYFNPEEWGIMLKLHDLSNQIYNLKRFEEISCIVIDYNMPEMNGIDFCKNMKNTHIKKILLTGTAEQSIAIEAFNKGIIDVFISKADPLLYEKLEEYLKSLSYKYFTDLSNLALNVIRYNNSEESALFLPAFQKLFAEQIKKYNIIEYYLIESYGCFLMATLEGELYGFFIYPEEELKDLFNEEVIALNWEEFFYNNPKIICFYSSENDEFPSEYKKYSKYLEKAEKLEEGTNWYWAITNKGIKTHKKKIKSFSKFKLSIKDDK